MDRNLQKSGLVNLLVLFVVGVAVYATSRYTFSLAGQVATCFLGAGVLVAAVSWFHARLEERERLEKLELDELAKGAGSTLFQTQETDTLLARRSREQFERYFVPIVAVVLFLFEAGAAYFFWHWLKTSRAPTLNQPLVAMGLMGLFALVLFLIGKYSAGLARLENQRLLRPSASYLLLAAYLCALIVLELVAFQAGANIDLYLAFALCGLLGLLAVETFVTLVLERFRPRLKGRQPHLLYQSRLVGLLSHPEDLFTTAAHVLDYQFGFKVSETWFYKFLQKSLAWLLLAQLGILLLSTCFVFLNAGEAALLERFGQPVAGHEVLGPGPHLKWPWPIDKAYRFRAQEIQSFNIGFEHGEKDAEEKAVLWTVSHYKEEFHLLVASREPAESLDGATVPPGAAATSGRKAPPVNLLSVGIPVQFQVTDLRAWAYNHKDPAALLESVGTREVVRYLVSADVTELMSTGRFPAGTELRRRMQARADELQLGVKILFVGLQDVHPPVQVAKAYEDVVGARQKREARILAAQAAAVRTNSMAGSEATRKKRQAEADSQRVQVTSLARAALFTNQIPAFRASPTVYAQRAYLQALTRGGAEARKVILATTNTQNVILMNLEEKVRPDLLDLSLPATKSK
jgi:regulator of protease activity HflC (stomatin/prohibitin superfamily)